MEDVASLVLRVQAQETSPTERIAAYSELVRRYQDMAAGYAFSNLGDFHLAEDAAQEAFLRAWEDLPGLQEPRAFATWFRRILTSRCARLTRGRRIETADMEEAADIASNAPDP